MEEMALFYFMAQVIERILELVDVLAGFFIDEKEEKNKKQHKIKSVVMWVLACLIALAFALWLDLHIMARMDVQVAPFIDCLLTALVLGSGTKPVHDVLKLIRR